MRNFSLGFCHSVSPCAEQVALHEDGLDRLTGEYSDGRSPAVGTIVAGAELYTFASLARSDESPLVEAHWLIFAAESRRPLSPTRLKAAV